MKAILNRKVMATLLVALCLAWLFIQTGASRYGEGSVWLLAIAGMLLGRVLAKPLARFICRESRSRADSSNASALQHRSPRAEMERRWRRLGSVRGSLLSDIDKQTDLSEALYRLEYGPRSSGDQSWLPPLDMTQNHDLQLPMGPIKRKRKPKRYG